MPAVIERNADPKELLAKAGRSVDAFRQDAEYLGEHRAELTQSYPNEWVAIFEGQVVAHSRQSRDVMRQLRLAGLVNRSPVIQFLTTQPITLIL
jgi:hypothetical protein